MLIALLVLGIALVAFGALVLMKYSDRPGGTIKWLGAEVTSKGAGLPLIALGVGLIGYAAVRFPGDVVFVRVPADSGLTTNTLLGSGSDTSCVAALLSGVPRDRADTVEVGMKDLEIIGSHEKLDAPFVLMLTENGQRIGALRLRLYGGSSSATNLFKIEQATDATCGNVTQIRNTSRGGNPRELLNWDTMRATLGAHQYDLRLGGEGSINVGYFTRVP